MGVGFFLRIGLGVPLSSPLSSSDFSYGLVWVSRYRGCPVIDARYTL
jgi:hypothetical protein